MSEIHRIKCGNGNCYIIENGTAGVLVDTGKREYINQVIEACKFYHIKLIVLSASLKDFSRRTMQEFEPSVLLNEGDSLADYGINASIIALSGHTNGSIGIDVDNKYLIVGDALMNMFYPTVSMLFHNKNDMLESAGKISSLGDRTIYFGHGRPVPNKQWIK